MKIILITDDGTRIGEKNVPDNTILSDIICRNEFIASKLWSEEDIADCLYEKGFSTSQENIDAVINTGYIKGLDECSDGDWQIIYDAIHYANTLNNLQKGA